MTLAVSQDFKNNVYGQTRQFDGRFTFNVPGYINNQVYLDDRIMKFDIIEEFPSLADTLPSNQCSITLDNRDGTFNFLTFSNMTQILASQPTMKFEIGLHVPVSTKNPDGIEWLPLGYYFLDSWQSDWDVQTVSLIGHDWLTQLSNIPFNSATYSNMNALVTAIFNTAGITNYSIDSSLNNFNTSKIVPKSYDCRTLLQSVGLATMCAVYQDRSGKMIVQPFPTLQSSGMFSAYTSSDNTLWHYPGSNTYSEINDDSGNKHISLANMYVFPKVSLEKSIYQLKVNVYSNGAINHAKTYTNGALNGGINGFTFTIDNPLIDSDSMADSVSKWYINESNYNAVYSVDWRQNPSLQSGDMVLVDDGMPVGGQAGTTTDKVARVTKQEFVYQGYLQGTSECRGGY
jgi:hypothetical protein